MNTAQIPVMIDAFLTHVENGCQGSWQLSRVPHPTSPGTLRAVLSCDGCAAGHVYDMRSVPAAEVLEDVEGQDLPRLYAVKP